MKFKEYISESNDVITESKASNVFRFVLDGIGKIGQDGGQGAVNKIYEKIPDFIENVLGKDEFLKASTANINASFGIDEKKNNRVFQVAMGKALYTALKKAGYNIEKDASPDEAAWAIKKILKVK